MGTDTLEQERIGAILSTNFPIIRSPELRDSVKLNGSIMEVPGGAVLMEIGSVIKTIPMLINGSIKILREDQDGNEILIYYLQAGETCAMSLTCCMANETSKIKAIATEDVQMIRIPVRFMEEWMAFPDWRNFVMGTYRQRFEELLNSFDSIAFHKMDERLIDFLKTRGEVKKTDTVEMSHQEIATDLHTSREVVSRLLKQMEKRGMIELGRNKVKLVDLSLN
jgi:CRP/FNR family transcriptional regulator, anaerobic regulatory protein